MQSTQLGTAFSNWDALSGRLADTLPHTDVAALGQLGNDLDAGLDAIAKAQHLTPAEAAAILKDRILLSGIF